MSVGRILTIATASCAVCITFATPAQARPASDTAQPRITTQAQLDAQLQGQGLAHRHLPQCEGMTNAVPTPELRGLNYTTGHWEGIGWSQFPGQQRNTFIQVEDVRFTTPNVLEMTGASHDPSDFSKITFRGHAVVSPRPDGTLQWLAGFAPQTLDTTLNVLPDGWSWDDPMGPGAVLHYEAHYSHGDRAWHETGQLTVDGGRTWTTVEDMTLIETCHH